MPISPEVPNSTDTAMTLRCQFLASRWVETAYEQGPGSGKLSRAEIDNQLSGDLIGQGWLQYLLCYPPVEGTAVAFTGFERLQGDTAYGPGSLVVQHEGVFDPARGVSGRLRMLSGSGTGVFAGFAGAGEIRAKAGEHGGEYRLVLEKRA
ncbi:MAG: DUF3224 domain-containing protein [Pseudomonas sp.]|uniref:DUF3224 domain-containing protein n=1 Tax=Pseudomonas sp. TaxID=306 RepID=UPI00339516A2